MKKLCWFFAFVVLASCSSTEDQTAQVKEIFPNAFTIRLTNPLDTARPDALVRLGVREIKERHAAFNPAAFAAFDGSRELSGQSIDRNGDGRAEQIAFLVKLLPEEEKTITIRFADSGMVKRDYPKRTQAELSVKTGGEWQDRKYIGGKFKNVDFLRVPPEHTDHSFFIRYEGPGWESDKVGYRFYLDWRNAVDIFGKKTAAMVLQNVGQDGFDSYHEMADWGADIFKVGNSLGLGSIAMWRDGKLVMVSETDSVTSQIVANGPVYSQIRTNYYGWKVGEQKYHLTSDLSIAAGKRLTNAHLKISGNPANLATGLVKHENTEFFTSDSGSGENWQYMALWGRQTLMDDNLGIAVLYQKEDLIGLREDDTNYIVVLRPAEGLLDYGFLAAWEKEPQGIRTLTAFRDYLDMLAAKMNHPVMIDLR